MPVLGFQLLPQGTRAEATSAVMCGDVAGVALAVAIGLLILDAVFIGAALARFQRARLILD